MVRRLLTDGVEEVEELLADAAGEHIASLGETVNIWVAELEVADDDSCVW
jgi:hypothetical protein